jgi:hypothetical protein
MYFLVGRQPTRKGLRCVLGREVLTRGSKKLEKKSKKTQF